MSATVTKQQFLDEQGALYDRLYAGAAAAPIPPIIIDDHTKIVYDASGKATADYQLLPNSPGGFSAAKGSTREEYAKFSMGLGGYGGEHKERYVTMPGVNNVPKPQGDIGWPWIDPAVTAEFKANCLSYPEGATREAAWANAGCPSGYTTTGNPDSGQSPGVPG
jgi:hypothetical protein